MKHKSLSDKLISIRRHMHENPELSDKEYETLEYVKSILREEAIDFVEVPSGGLLAFIKGSEDSDRTILLRADLDALPIKEEDKNLKNVREVKSKKDGVMHACGHDGHTAMLIGAGILLKDMDFRGNVILAFERGEEATQNYRYLLAYLDYKKIKIDTAFAIHVSPDHDTGVFAIREGWMNAAPVIFDIEIEGQSGHGARPYLANNPLDSFHEIYSGLRAMRVEDFDPFTPLTYSICEVKMGETANQIPGSLRFRGTARFYDREKIGYKFYEKFKKLIEDVCEKNGTRPIFHHYMKPHFSIVNERANAELLRKSIKNELGEEYVEESAPSMGSDPFSDYLAVWKGLYINFGIRNKEKGSGAPLHSAYFDLDEDALILGARGVAAYARDFLNSDLEVPKGDYYGNVKGLLREEERDEKEIEEIYERVKEAE